MSTPTAQTPVNTQVFAAGSMFYRAIAVHFGLPLAQMLASGYTLARMESTACTVEATFRIALTPDDLKAVLKLVDEQGAALLAYQPVEG